jgi:SAM-dependent methyltransferase
VSNFFEGFRQSIAQLIWKDSPNRHFVRDYEKLVKRLKKVRPLDEAMAVAVGGSYELFGQIEANLLRQLGLADGMRLLDFGCGSGRLAAALCKTADISYVGIDIVQDLLNYARSKTPDHYQFLLNREMSIPLPDGSADMICAFSVFTHLHHDESYLYLEEFVRVLKPGGKIIISFLEFAEPAHWQIFLETKNAVKASTRPHVNCFIERNVLELWAGKLGLKVEKFISGGTPVWNGHAFGQSVAILNKPAA